MYAKIIFLLLFFLPLAQATDLGQIDQWALIDMGDGTYINLTGPQNFTEINAIDGLNISINNSYSIYSNTANLTLGNISYSFDRLRFNATATAGTMNVTRRTNRTLPYKLNVDQVQAQTATASANIVSFLYSTWSEHIFEIGPLYDWWNSQTDDDKVYVHPGTGSSTSFALLQDGVTSGVWTKDGESVSDTTSEISTSFSKAGNHIITGYGNTASGITGTVTWYIVALRPKSDPSDQTANLNTSWWDSLMAAMDGASPDFTAFFAALMLPFTTDLGNMFYLFVYLLPLVVIWIRQERAILPVGLGIIFGYLLLNMLPTAWQGPAILFMALTVVGVLYSLFKEKG